MFLYKREKRGRGFSGTISQPYDDEKLKEKFKSDPSRKTSEVLEKEGKGG